MTLEIGEVHDTYLYIFAYIWQLNKGNVKILYSILLHEEIEGYSLDRFNLTEWIWPKEFDRKIWTWPQTEYDKKWLDELDRKNLTTTKMIVWIWLKIENTWRAYFRCVVDIFPTTTKMIMWIWPKIGNTIYISHND